MEVAHGKKNEAVILFLFCFACVLVKFLILFCGLIKLSLKHLLDSLVGVYLDAFIFITCALV